MEIGISSVARFRKTSSFAARAEALGFASAIFSDSQNLCAEVWTELALATDRIRLGPRVTNSVTREPAVVGASLETLSKEILPAFARA